MKFIAMPNIFRTNALFSKLKALDPRRSIELEAYSCKQTRQQKALHDIPKPLRFYVATLEQALPDYDFSDAPRALFAPTSLEALREELSFVLFTIYRNQEDVRELLAFVDRVLEQCVRLRSCLFYVVSQPGGETRVKVFLIHDTRRRRIVVVKVEADGAEEADEAP